jgi:hypothetical protein
MSKLTYRIIRDGNGVMQAQKINDVGNWIFFYDLSECVDITEAKDELRRVINSSRVDVVAEFDEEGNKYLP